MKAVSVLPSHHQSSATTSDPTTSTSTKRSLLISTITNSTNTNTSTMSTSTAARSSNDDTENCTTPAKPYSRKRISSSPTPSQSPSEPPAFQSEVMTAPTNLAKTKSVTNMTGLQWILGKTCQFWQNSSRAELTSWCWKFDSLFVMLSVWWLPSSFNQPPYCLTSSTRHYRDHY